MQENWKQIWQDIRSALREPMNQAEETTASLPKAMEAMPSSASDPAADTALISEPELPPALLMPTVTEPLKPISEPKPWVRRINSVIAVSIVLALGFLLWRGGWLRNAPAPPAPNVVATFTGGQITVEDVQQHIALLMPADTLRDTETYRMVVQEMLTDELVRRWATERKADSDENLQHVMQHITEEINLDELHAQMHQDQMGVAEGDIQAYYEANRTQFGDQTLTQVNTQIRSLLETQQEDQFVANYIQALKEKATITRDFALLDVPEPEDRELQAYYTANLALYKQPSQATVDEIQIAIGSDESAARQQADKALIRLRAGEAFSTVANEMGETPIPAEGVTVSMGVRDAAYDEIIFNLDQNEISDVFRSGDAFYIVRLRAQQPERQYSLDEVRTQLRQAVLQEKEQAWFAEKTELTLFTIHGKSYRVGEFWQEYQELPVAFRSEYQGGEGRKQLAEQIIERMLLVEDSYDRLLTDGNESTLEEARLDILAQMMEQEEIDDQILVTDEELQSYYEQNRDLLISSPQARIRQIVIRLGQTEDEWQRARDKADEAYKKVAPGLFQQGEDFGEIARQYSEDEATAGNGGEVVGWIGEGSDLLAELTEHPLHQQILTLGTGDISSPVEWANAIHIIQVIERKEPQPLTFDAIKEALREELSAQKHDELLLQFQDMLLTEANITIYDSVLATGFGDITTPSPE